jgi:hypothetical protein
VGVVRGAVERIDQPGGRGPADLDVALLSEDGMLREPLADDADDGPLRRQVRPCDDRRALVLLLHLQGAPQALDQDGAAGTRRRDRRVQQVVRCRRHAPQPPTPP